MLNLSGNTGIVQRTVVTFLDYPRWRELFTKHATRYSEPNWDAECTPEAMAIWVDRIISERLYMQHSATRHKDWIELNPGWPLGSFIGLLLEIADETR